MSSIEASPDRFEFVDSLRGFALFGVFAANLLIFAGVDYLTDAQRVAAFTSPLDATAFFLERFFIENKFMGLFAVLFGVSFWLFLRRLDTRGAPAIRVFHRRIFWLFVFGLAHGWLLWCFDILRFYALWAVLLPLFVRTAPRRLLAMALFASVLLPALVEGANAWSPASPTPGPDYDAIALAAFSKGSYYDVLRANWQYDWYLTLSVGQIAYQVAMFGRLLVGLYIARTFDFCTLDGYRTMLLKIVVIGGVVGVIGNTVFATKLLSHTGHSALLAFTRECVIQGGFLGFTLAYASALALAFSSVRWRPVIQLLSPVGRMALTWYLLQTIFGIVLFYGLVHRPALVGHVPPSLIAIMAVAGFGAQIVFARLWLQRFRFGPAEWVWRGLTYGEAPVQRTAALDDAAV
jgi:uncharacterized protein